MSVAITGRYVGDKRVELGHGPSGAKLVTAAPVDNQGDGSSFSPTDLVAGALGACALTVMAIVAERSGLDLAGARFALEKHMSASPRRLGEVPVTIHLPGSLAARDRAKLEAAARACPVHASLHPDVKATLTFVYDVGGA
jgi:uncharacterized OsmC-like protein